MSWLRIRCLGPLDVTVNGAPLHDLHRSPALQALLGYFVLHRNQVLARWQVAGTFWPEKGEAQARRALNTLLWRFQQVGDGILAAGLELSRQTLRWSPPPWCWIDVEAFEQLSLLLDEVISREGADEGVLLELQHAVQLYRGPLLANVDAEWCAGPRAMYHERYMLALETLVSGYERIGQLETALVWAARLVEVEPYRESGHAALIRLNVALKRPAEAMAAYQRYVRLWQEELGLTPTDLLQQQEANVAHTVTNSPDVLFPDLWGRLFEWSRDQRVPEVETFFRHLVQAAGQLAEEAEAAGRRAVACHAYEFALALLSNLPPTSLWLRSELAMRLNYDRIHDLIASRHAQRDNMCQALVIARALKETTAESDVCARLCWVAQREGRLSEAASWAKKALQLAGQDPRLNAQALRLLGSSYELQGLYATARAYHERALALDAEDSEWQRLDHLNLCSVYTFMGDDWKALEHARSALSLIPSAPPTPLRALALGNLANVERALGNYGAALHHVREAQAIAHMVGARELQAWLAGRAAHLYAQMGEIAHARLWAARAWTISVEVHNCTAQIEAGLVLGYVACVQEDWETARRWCRQIEPLLAAESGRRYRAPVLVLNAHLDVVEQRFSVAEEAIVQSLACLAETGEERRRAGSLVLLATIALSKSNHSTAERHVAEARKALLERAERIPDPVVRDRFCSATPLRRFLTSDMPLASAPEGLLVDGELLVVAGHGGARRTRRG